jgi:hypothetical protein
MVLSLSILKIFSPLLRGPKKKPFLTLLNHHHERVSGGGGHGNSMAKSKAPSLCQMKDDRLKKIGEDHINTACWPLKHLVPLTTGLDTFL